MRHKIDLAAALAAASDQPAAEMTLAELVGAFNSATAGDHDWRLRKWLDGMGHLSA